LLKNEDFLIYDIHEGIGLTNPVIRKDRTILDTITLPCKVALRSAINTGIQNTRLHHGEIVYEADNSLSEMFSQPSGFKPNHGEIVCEADNSLSEMFSRPLGFNAFGDFAGIKKDNLTSGDTISPGFILYNPADNLYYGYKGTVKKLEEFETTIVPDVLASTTAEAIRAANPDFLNDKNEGWNTLLRIKDGRETGKSQAKFKRISIEHYLHCMRTAIAAGQILQAP